MTGRPVHIAPRADYDCGPGVILRLRTCCCLGLGSSFRCFPAGWPQQRLMNRIGNIPVSVRVHRCTLHLQLTPVDLFPVHTY